MHIHGTTPWVPAGACYSVGVRAIPILLSVVGLSACVGTSPDLHELPVAGLVDTGPCAVGLEVGDCAPDFTLDGTDGSELSLSEQGSQRILVFGTANW